MQCLTPSENFGLVPENVRSELSILCVAISRRDDTLAFLYLNLPGFASAWTGDFAISSSLLKNPMIS